MWNYGRTVLLSAWLMDWTRLAFAVSFIWMVNGRFPRTSHLVEFRLNLPVGLCYGADWSIVV